MHRSVKRMLLFHTAVQCPDVRAQIVSEHAEIHFRDRDDSAYGTHVTLTCADGYVRREIHTRAVTIGVSAFCEDSPLVTKKSL